MHAINFLQRLAQTVFAGHEKNELAEVILGPAGIKHILESDRNTSSEIHDNC